MYQQEWQFGADYAYIMLVIYEAETRWILQPQSLLQDLADRKISMSWLS